MKEITVDPITAPHYLFSLQLFLLSLSLPSNLLSLILLSPSISQTLTHFIKLSLYSHPSSPCLLRAGRRAATPPCPTSCAAASRGAPRTRPPPWPRQGAPCWASPMTPPASRSTSPCYAIELAREAASPWPLRPTSRSPSRYRTWLLQVSQGREEKGRGR